MKDFEELLAYQKAFKLAMQIHQISKKFPIEERYSLTDQVRRSSRSVCACLAEGYRKRKYPKHFVAKITDSDMENAETKCWIQFALACKYIDQNEYDNLVVQSEEIGKILGFMINNPDRFR